MGGVGALDAAAKLCPLNTILEAAAAAHESTHVGPREQIGPSTRRAAPAPLARGTLASAGASLLPENITDVFLFCWGFFYPFFPFQLFFFSFVLLLERTAVAKKNRRVKRAKQERGGRRADGARTLVGHIQGFFLLVYLLIHSFISFLRRAGINILQGDSIFLPSDDLLLTTSFIRKIDSLSDVSRCHKYILKTPPTPPSVSPL